LLLYFNNEYVIIILQQRGTLKMFEVEFYEDRNGNEPIKDFIVDLQAKGQTSKNDRIRSEKILTYIRVLQEYGTRAGEPYVKHIEDDIWELRPLDDRIFFFYFRDNTFVLLHHFLKKTKKTPRREIEQAKRNLTDYLERSK
jgi:phage-related protein